MALAGRLERQDRAEAAALIYGELDQSGSPVAERARHRLQILQGGGSFGEQAELALRNLTRSVTDPAALFAMGAAGTIYRLGRLTVLSRLLTNPSAGLFTRGLGARALASTVAFGAEGAVFPAAYDLAAGALDYHHPHDGDFSSRLLSSYCVLGGLRLAGFAGRGFTRGLNVQSGLSSMVFGQAVMFGGILAGHGLERAAGLRPDRPWSSTLAESLATLIHFNIAGSLLRRLGGPRFEAWNHEVDRQNYQLGRNYFPLAVRPALPNGDLGPAEALAGGRTYMAAQNSGEGGGPPRPEAPLADVRYRQMAESAWGVFVTLNLEGKVVDVNPAVERVFGYKPEEVMGQSLTILMAPDMAARHEAGFRRYLASGQRRINWNGENLPGRHKNGQTVSLHIAFGEFERAGNRFFTGIMREVDRPQEETPVSATLPAAGPSGQRVLKYGSLLGVTTSLLGENPPLIAALATGDVRVQVQRSVGEGLTPEFMENFVKVLNFHSRQRHLFESGEPRVWIEILEEGTPRHAARVAKKDDGFAWEMMGSGRSSTLGRTTGSYEVPDLRAATKAGSEGANAETGDRPFARATQMLRRTTGRTTARLPRIPGLNPESALAPLAQLEMELNGAIPRLPEELTRVEFRVPLKGNYASDFFAVYETDILTLLGQRCADLPLPLGYRIVLQAPGVAGPSEVTYIKAIGGFRRE